MADFKKLKDGQGNSYNVKDETARTNLASHTGNTSNPHSVTKAQVGLGNVDNTSDANKPISNAQATVNAAKFDKANVKSSPGSTPSDDNVLSEKYAEDHYTKHNTYDGTLSVKKADEADVAKNIKAYSSDSGALQENPFISQGTGTNNNTEIVTTGTNCEIKSKNGNTVVVNQAVKTKSVSFVTTDTGTKNLSDINYSFVSGHKYLITANQNITLTSVARNLLVLNIVGQGFVSLMSYGTASGSLSLYATENVNLSAGFKTTIFTCSTSVTGLLQYWCYTPSADVTISEINVIDLTQWFKGNDNIPADLLAHPEYFSWYYNGSLAYNEGTLVNANGRYLECGQGRNLFDEQTELGLISLETGLNVSGYTDRWRSIDYCPCVPNKRLNVYFKNTAYDIYILWYDSNYNYLGYNTVSYSQIVTPPVDAWFFKLRNTPSSGSTYNHDITISLYYTPEQGGEGYNQHYDYVAPKVIDTGSEVLRSAGNVRDIKTPDGTITRNVGVVDMSELPWLYISDGSYFRCQIPTMLTSALGNDLTCDKYTPVNKSLSEMVSGEIKKGTGENILYLKDSSLNTSTPNVTGNLNYPLATPTTSQGTPFSAYPDINDYSYMLWKDTDNNLVSVPQGASIFYPVNYAGTLDDLVAYVDGDVTNLAKKSDLATDKQELQGVDTILQNAIGGTLRQCLCVKESLDFNDTDVVNLGTINWTYDSTYHYFYSDVFSSAKTSAKCMASKYKTIAQNFSDPENKSVFIGSNNRIVIADNSYTDATTFKNAMKGVLLAYEKASS